MVFSNTLYRCDEMGRPHRDTPIACLTIDDEGKLEIRTVDGTILVAFDNLDHLGYTLLWANYGNPTYADLAPYARPRLRY